MDIPVHSRPKPWVDAIVTLVFLFSVLHIFRGFINWAELRPGAVFYDPLLILFNPIDLTVPTFVMVYAGLALAFFSLRNEPREIFAFGRGYTILILFRMVTIYLMPLEPPLTMIPLADPVVEFFATGDLVTKDLFFSGHTATPFLYASYVKNFKIKIVIWILMALIAGCILAQHVHYSIDVIAAPFFAYGAMRFSKFLDRKILPFLASAF